MAWLDQRRGFEGISRARVVFRTGGGAGIIVHRCDLDPTSPAPNVGDRVRFEHLGAARELRFPTEEAGLTHRLGARIGLAWAGTHQ